MPPTTPQFRKRGVILSSPPQRVALLFASCVGTHMCSLMYVLQVTISVDHGTFSWGLVPEQCPLQSQPNLCTISQQPKDSDGKYTFGLFRGNLSGMNLALRGVCSFVLVTPLPDLCQPRSSPAAGGWVLCGGRSCSLTPRLEHRAAPLKLNLPTGLIYTPEPNYHGCCTTLSIKFQEKGFKVEEKLSIEVTGVGRRAVQAEAAGHGRIHKGVCICASEFAKQHRQQHQSHPHGTNASTNCDTSTNIIINTRPALTPMLAAAPTSSPT